MEPREWITHSVAETEAIGESLGRAAVPGQVFALSGDLGAGKTQLARGIARGVGCTDRAHSPTFGLIHVYAGGRCPVFHLDLYRLESPEAVLRAGLEQYLEQPAGITVVEWGERWFCASNPAALNQPGWVPVTVELLGELDRKVRCGHPRP